MRNRWTIALAAATASWCGGAALSAQSPPTISSLIACPFAQAEVEGVLGVKLRKGEAADMKTPNGRDVGCIHALKDGTVVFAVRQTWDSTIPTAAGSQAAAPVVEAGATPIAGDPDRASWKADAAGDGGELIYTRGKVRTRVMLHGGTFSSAQAQQLLRQLRRIP